LAKYLLRGNYTVEGIKGVRKEGGARRVEAVEAAARSVGGSLESFYFGFGGDDFYVIVDLPDIVRAAAISTAVAATGAARVETVVLLTAQDVDAAAQINVEYRAPGK
jgi:uncharacterized protein with GYD domain